MDNSKNEEEPLDPEHKRPPTNPVFCTKYQTVRNIGSGSYSYVWLVKSLRDGQLFAAKIGKLTERNSHRIVQEYQIMLQLKDCPNILGVQEFLCWGNSFCFVLELCDQGDLYDLVRCHHNWQTAENVARNIGMQMIDALLFAHEKGYVHMDLKLENILLKTEGIAKVGDWGFARPWQKGTIIKDNMGSPRYVSPEVLNSVAEGPESDVWSLGVCLYSIVCGHQPFAANSSPSRPEKPGIDFQNLFRKIKNAEYIQPKACSPMFNNLLLRVFTTTTEERITLCELKEHPWFHENDEFSSDNQTEEGLVEDEKEQAPSDYDIKKAFERDLTPIHPTPEQLLLTQSEVVSNNLGRDVAQSSAFSKGSPQEKEGEAKTITPRSRKGNKGAGAPHSTTSSKVFDFFSGISTKIFKRRRSVDQSIPRDGKEMLRRNTIDGSFDRLVQERDVTPPHQDECFVGFISSEKKKRNNATPKGATVTAPCSGVETRDGQSPEEFADWLDKNQKSKTVTMIQVA